MKQIISTPYGLKIVDETGEVWGVFGSMGEAEGKLQEFLDAERVVPISAVPKPEPPAKPVPKHKIHGKLKKR